MTECSEDQILKPKSNTPSENIEETVLNINMRSFSFGQMVPKMGQSISKVGHSV
jgi:hypothetical protein